MALLTNSSTAAEIMDALNDIAAINNRTELVNAVGAPSVVTDTMSTIVTNIQTSKNTLVTNTTALGVTAAGTETLASLVTKVGTVTKNGAVTLTPGTANVTIAKGYHNGSGYVVGDADLVSANIKSGANIFGVAGNSNVVDTSPGTATAAQIRSGAIAFVDGAQLTGNLTVQSTVAQTITPGIADIVKPAGIYDGAITVAGDADLLSANILTGKTIFGVAGSLTTGYSSGSAIDFVQLGLGLPITLWFQERWGSGVIDNSGNVYCNGIGTGGSNTFYKFDKSGNTVWSQTGIQLGNISVEEDSTYLYIIEYNPIDSGYDYGITKINKSTGVRTYVCDTYKYDSVIIGKYNTTIYYLFTNSSTFSIKSATGTVSTALSSTACTNAYIQGSYLYTANVVSGTLTIKKFNIATAGSESLVWTYTVAATSDTIAADSNGYVYFFTSGTSTLNKLNTTGTAIVTSTSDIRSTNTPGGMYTTDKYIIFNTGGIYDFNLATISKQYTSLSCGSSNRLYYCGLYTQTQGSVLYAMSVNATIK